MTTDATRVSPAVGATEALHLADHAHPRSTACWRSSRSAALLRRYVQGAAGTDEEPPDPTADATTTDDPRPLAFAY